MRTLRFIATCLAVPLSIAAAPAFAQDQPAPSAPAPDTTTSAPEGTANESDTNGSRFLGFRVAGQVAYDRFQALGGTHDGVGYGAEAGFDGQIGPVVIGPSVSYYRGDDAQVCAPQSGGNACTKSFREVAATARVGLQVAPALLIYGKGGYVTNYQRKFFNSSAPGGAGSYYRRYNSEGFTVGGGAEYALGKHFFIDTEYRFSQYNDHTSRHRALAGFGIRF